MICARGVGTYYLEEEKAGDWSVFIVNDQFNDILRTVVRSVMNNDLDAHKSFWIEGTYGTGKTHAGAVLKHLLCDDVSAIEEWLREEYKLPKFEGLCQSVFDLRKKKRLFPVTLYGASSIAHPDDLSLQLQQKIQEALIKAGLTDLEVKTDYDTYIKHIDENQQFWEMLIEQSQNFQRLLPMWISCVKNFPTLNQKHCVWCKMLCAMPAFISVWKMPISHNGFLKFKRN